MIRVLVANVFIVAGLTFAPLSAGAEAFSWHDSSGTQFFGTNPPPGAVNVKKLQARSFSRYSSEKVIRTYNKSADSASRMAKHQVKETDLPTTNFDEAPLEGDRPGPRARLVEAPELSTGSTVNIPGNSASATLEQGKITVTHDVNQWVSACKVVVRNTGPIAAQKVLVSFEFEDGTIVPAKGPEIIAPRGESVYFIAPENLPVKVHYQRPARTVTGISYQKLPRPKVILQSTPTA